MYKSLIDILLPEPKKKKVQMPIDIPSAPLTPNLMLPAAYQV